MELCINEIDEYESDDNIVLGDKIKIPHLECELFLCYLNKKYNSGDGCSIVYHNYLKKKIKEVREKYFSKLSNEEIDILNMLQKYPLTLINKSIKNNIDEFKELILPQK